MRNKLLIIILFISIMITTIVYSAFNTTLQIKGDAIVRTIQDIRITNVSVTNSTNNAYETYNNKYSKDTTSLYATLPASSSITYTVEITNKHNSKYVISNIGQQSHTNSNVTYLVSENYIIINGNSTKTFTITLTNNTQTEQEETLMLKYTFEKATAIFEYGTSFCTKIKTLAGDDTTNSSYPAEMIDRNITSIRRAYALPSSWIDQNNNINVPSNDNIVSTSTSPFPIYAWFDNGTIYYYTEVINPYVNNSAQNMFRGLSKVTYIDIVSLDTSKTVSMHAMFKDCAKLQTIDLSNFDTSSVNVSITYMFDNCSSLTTLDLSNFDLSRIPSSTNMLTGLASLETLKTPKVYPSSLSITLPKTMYDSNNNAYTSLDSSSPTETWLNDGN